MVSHGYSPLKGKFLRVTQPFATFSPEGDLVLLACLMHAASVYPGPGSNPQKVTVHRLTTVNVYVNAFRRRLNFKDKSLIQIY
jgi:hypothetical protein